MSQPFLPGTPPEEVERGYKALSDRIRKENEEHAKFIEDHEKCFSCKGHGSVPHWDAGPEGFMCDTCKGSGWATKEKNQSEKDAWDKWCEGMRRCSKNAEASIKLAENMLETGKMPLEQCLSGDIDKQVEIDKLFEEE